jgi:hypothetical protein
LSQVPFEQLEHSVQRNFVKKAAPNRSKISIQNDYELKYWARHFGVTREDLQRAIEKVGNSAASVHKQLQTSLADRGD